MREGWTYKKLGEICKVITKGTTPTTIGYKFTDNGINFIKIECIDSNRNLIKENLTFISEECNNSMIRSQLQEKDLLFSIAGALGRIYIVEKSVLPANTNQALAIIRLSDKQDLFLLYLSYFLNSDTIKRQIEKDKVGVAQLNLSLGQIKDFIIPIPSIAEQQRIVSELDLLSSIIEKKKAQLKEYNQLAQSIFYDMFGDPVTNEKGWEVKKLGEVSESELGKTLNSSKDKGKLYPYLCAVNVLWNKIDTSTLKETRFEETELERYSVKKGDLLVCEGGDIGRAAIWQEEYPIQYQNALHRLRFKDTIIPCFCLMFLQSLKEKGILDTRYGKGVTIKHLVKSALLSIPIPLPPLSLQQSFASKIEAIERLKALVQQSITEAETLFNSRMDYYFN